MLSYPLVEPYDLSDVERHVAGAVRAIEPGHVPVQRRPTDSSTA